MKIATQWPSQSRALSSRIRRTAWRAPVSAVQRLGRPARRDRRRRVEQLTDATDVSCMAGHANVRTTLLMYVGTTAGVLDRARKATD